MDRRLSMPPPSGTEGSRTIARDELRFVSDRSYALGKAVASRCVCHQNTIAATVADERAGAGVSGTQHFRSGPRCKTFTITHPMGQNASVQVPHADVPP
jgi:hypothetical protein